MGIFSRKKKKVKKRVNGFADHPVFKDIEPRCMTCKRLEPLHPVHEMCHDCIMAMKKR